jgi:transcriptional regulator with GAF, ATPase, and Fis domain
MAIFHVHLIDTGKHTEPPMTRRRGSALPGVVGRSSSWHQSCDRVVRYLRAGDWLAVSGETGTGRSTVLRAGAALTRGNVRVFAAADLQIPESLDALDSELDRDDFSVILRDIDTLDGDTLATIADMLQGREGAGWVGVTVGDVTVDALHDADAAAILLPFFTHTVPIPPLRHRIEDLHDLIPALLRQLTRGRELTVSSAAMRQLTKYSWPGNVAELRQILRQIVTHQRSGVIDVNQLPPTCRALSRHTLTRIEAMERDAIIRSLEENGGHKPAAAAALGISRATIYRKIKEFGIDV